jgi:hypothetical protein
MCLLAVRALLPPGEAADAALHEAIPVPDSARLQGPTGDAERPASANIDAWTRPARRDDSQP